MTYPAILKAFLRIFCRALFAFSIVFQISGISHAGEAGWEVLIDTDKVESGYGSALRARYSLPDLSALRHYKVIDKSTNQPVSSVDNVTITVAIAAGASDEDAKESLSAVYQWVSEHYPLARSVQVHPIFEGQAESEARQGSVKAVGSAEGPPFDRTRYFGDKVFAGVYHFAALAMRKAVHSRRYQMYLVGTASAVMKMGLSYSFWSADNTLARDAYFIRFALGAALPQDFVWGFMPAMMQKVMNEWPRALGLRVNPTVAAYVWGIGVGLANAMWFRETVHQAQMAHPELVSEGANPVDSAFTGQFFIDFAKTDILGIIPGTLAGKAVRSAMLKGQISRTTESLIYQVFGFETMIKTFIVSAMPSLVNHYSVISNTVKLAIFAASKTLQPKKGRILLIDRSISESARKDVYYRFGVEDDPNLIISVPPEAFNVEGVAELVPTRYGFAIAGEGSEEASDVPLAKSKSWKNCWGVFSN
jgi:hypothetical protein